MIRQCALTALVLCCLSTAGLAQSSPDDVKDAGHNTKQSAKDAGKTTAKTAKKAARKAKSGTKKAVHSVAGKMEEGAAKVKTKSR
jgi:hypothetical protein